MKNSPKGFFSLLAVSSSVLLSAQTLSGFSDITVQFKSDTSTKSVLLSNAVENGVGDMSPFIGAASWYDLNKPLVCRSLLSFDIGIMQKVIRPEQITEAYLVLRPYDPVANSVEKNIPGNMQFFVRRVAESWVDSLTSWQTQPAVFSAMEPNRVQVKNKKTPEVRVDITETVRDMFRQGNNGFMITLKEAEENASTRTHYWFASARNEDEKLRPELWVNISWPISSAFPNDDFPVFSPNPRGVGFPPVNPVFMSPYSAPPPILPPGPPQQGPVKEPVKDKETGSESKPGTKTEQ